MKNNHSQAQNRDSMRRNVREAAQNSDNDTFYNMGHFENSEIDQELYNTMDELEKREEKKRDDRFKLTLKILVFLLFASIGWFAMEVMRLKGVLDPFL